MPDWAVEDGEVDDAVLWAALDCTSGFYSCLVPEFRPAVTGEYAVELHRRLLPDDHLALVAWDPTDDQCWNGRVRRAAAQAFDESGSAVATAVSTWVALK